MTVQDDKFAALNKRYWDLSIEDQARIQRMLPEAGSVDESRYTRLFEAALERMEREADEDCFIGRSPLDHD